jgi:hypothetical protein
MTDGASSTIRSYRPSGSLVLAATIVGNGSGARGVGSQPFSRNTCCVG